MSRLRRTAALALTALVVALLGACTSDGRVAPEETTDPGDGIEGSIPESGWYCRFFNTLTIEAGAGEDADIAREVLRVNDPEGWQCEVVVPVDGGPETSPIFTFTIRNNDPEAIEEWREKAIENQAVSGRESFGESYVWPGATVAIVPCKGAPGTEDVGVEVPHLFVVEAWTEGGQTEEGQELVSRPINYVLRELDASLGCAPSRAADPVDTGANGATTAP